MIRAGIAIWAVMLCMLTANAQNVVTLAGQNGVSGAANGSGTSASFNNPHGMVCDQAGNLFVADRNNHLIRKITPAGVVSTFAGSGSAGSSDGIGAAASFFEPWGIAIDQSGNLYVADTKNYLIRKITPTAVVTTIAGVGTSGVTDGPASSAQFGFPTGIAVDASGNIYVSEFMTHVIRKISNGNVTTFAGTAFQSGDANGTGNNAKFDHPHSLAIGQSGNLFVTDTWNNKIRKITPSGVVSTYAGSTAGYVDGAASVSKFDNPLGICADASGDIFVGDVNNFCIRKISNGTVTTFAGTAGTSGSANGPLLQASFNSPSCMAYHSSDKYFIGDEGNELIRLINMNQSSNPLTLSTLNNVSVFCPSSTSVITASPQGLSSYTFKEGSTVLATNTTGILSLGTLSAGTHLISCTATGPLGNYATTTALSITIVDASTPVISPTGPISICSGGSATLTASPGIAYLWTNGATTSSINATLPGTYAVSITYTGGCSYQSNSVIINLNGSFSAAISPATAQVICPGDSVKLTATAGTSYLWSNGKTTQSIYAKTAANYTVAVTSSFGCTSVSPPVNVSLKAMPASIEASSDSSCSGEGVLLTITQQSNTTYSWFDEAAGGTALATGSSYATAPLAESTTFYVQLNSNGCTSVSRFPVLAYIYPILHVDFAESQAVKADGGYAVSFQNNTPTGNNTYTWNFGDGSVNAISNEENPQHIYSSEGDYSVTLTVKDEFGCENSFTKNISVTVAHDLFLPSAFTPNSDGINDIFRLKGSGFVSADMLILDQWGQLIFRTNNAVVGWDGSVKGNLAPNGTYSYIVKIKLNDGSDKVLKGNISIIK